ncbi:putative odorant-binding protein A5 [Bemisia tabaci]|uniref:putative odorant-binding protein A5 n=1 Tax=Bemisia tabaci TaxID=7038 RepID=UPI003B28B3AE
MLFFFIFGGGRCTPIYVIRLLFFIIIALAIPERWAFLDNYEDEPSHTEKKDKEFEPTYKYNQPAYLDRHLRSAAEIEESLKKNEIIPNFFPISPKYEAFVTFEGGIEPNMGNVIRPEQARFGPHTIAFKYEPDRYYCIVMIGLDVPSRTNPTEREFLHWISGNFITDSFLAGDEIIQYYPILPKKDTGLHRYLFLVYEQKGKVEFKEPPLTDRNDWGRANWSSRKFAEKYNLGEPYAVNFFCSEYTNLTFLPTAKAYLTSEVYPAVSTIRNQI